MLNKVTITGACDSTDVGEMVELSAEFPFAEWGILLSKNQEGCGRFPSREWMAKFVSAASGKLVPVSAHLCGSWVRELLLGQLDWRDLPIAFEWAGRVQINTHAERHMATRAFFDRLGERPKQFIIQLDGVNDHLYNAALHIGHLNVSGLFDGSHGAGVSPERWPLGNMDGHYGYAGGLGPENVIAEIAKIERVAIGYFWIDMERKIRSEDDSVLDMAKVRKVLELTAPLVGELSI